MALLVSLKRNERVVINGAEMTVSRGVTLRVINDSRIELPDAGKTIEPKSIATEQSK